jgi:hypothetical protein
MKIMTESNLVRLRQRLRKRNGDQQHTYTESTIVVPQAIVDEAEWRKGARIQFDVITPECGGKTVLMRETQEGEELLPADVALRSGDRAWDIMQRAFQIACEEVASRSTEGKEGLMNEFLKRAMEGK